jgi:hypothetical protein
MKDRNWQYWILVVVAGATALTGLVQVVMPGFVLQTMSSEVNATSRHFFGIVGMFMFLFGGALLHALLSAAHHPIVVLWASLQKFGASLAVGLGALNQVFSPLALLVAAFDLFSGILGIWYWSSIRRLP